jgi:hypothetical protein
MQVPKSPPVRFLALVTMGFGTAAAFGGWFQPHYLPLCNRINTVPGVACTPVSTQAMVGLFLIGLGVISLIIVPIVTAIVHLLRHGHDWETPRGTETAHTNLPILAGFIYLVVGTFVAVAGY